MISRLSLLYLRSLKKSSIISAVFFTTESGKGTLPPSYSESTPNSDQNEDLTTEAGDQEPVNNDGRYEEAEQEITQPDAYSLADKPDQSQEWLSELPPKEAQIPSIASEQADAEPFAPEASLENSGQPEELSSETQSIVVESPFASQVRAKAERSEVESPVDIELGTAILESQSIDNAQNDNRPYTSDFPSTSPFLNEKFQPKARLQRNQFIQNLIVRTSTQSSKTENEQTDKNATESISPDPDTGFSELNQTTKENIAMLYLDQTIALHPSRLFFPGDTYEPEELHPMGIAQTPRSRRKPRTVRAVYTETTAREKLDFKNLSFLNNYLSDSGLILPRRETRLSRHSQKKLERSVKLAQALALLPVLDRRAEFKRIARRVQGADSLV